MNKLLLIVCTLLLAACGGRSGGAPDRIISMQMVDRNGFSETISNKDRLDLYQKVDFLAAQPYQKVLRVFGRDHQGKSHSRITSYHPNGQPWQYLEAVDGRAHGLYREWFENGKLKIEVTVIEGMADLSDIAQASWLFSGLCRVWSEEGGLEASFHYDKGVIQGEAFYFHPNGALAKYIPYEKGEKQGELVRYDENGQCIERISYNKGVRDGEAYGLWNSDQYKFREECQNGLLISGYYWNPKGELISQVENGNGKQAVFDDEHLFSLMEFREGKQEGLVELFDLQGALTSSSHWKDGKKEGEEQAFYPNKNPKLLVNWHEGSIQGVVKTWYQSGALESQREMSANKKHGLSFAYYQNGDLMLMEEYENDKLQKGSYFPKGEKNPISKINQGDGIATLYNSEGHFMKKIQYERGKPLVD